MHSRAGCGAQESGMPHKKPNILFLCQSEATRRYVRYSSCEPIDQRTPGRIADEVRCGCDFDDDAQQNCVDDWTASTAEQDAAGLADHPFAELDDSLAGEAEPDMERV